MGSRATGVPTGGLWGRRVLRREGDGFSLLELVAAMTVLTIVITGFAASVYLGFRTVAMARQRQGAAEIASARLEHLRSVPFDALALSSQPVHASDPENPDYFVSPDGADYDVTGDGDYEALVVDTDAGAVLHLEDPVNIGSTVLEIRQYVTEVNDPSVGLGAEVRRVSVAVSYKAPSVQGVGRIVRATSYFTPDQFVTEGTTTTTTTTTPPTSDPPTTIPTVECPGDVDPPTGDFAVVGSSGAELGFTASSSIAVAFDLADDCEPVVVSLSNDDVEWSGDIEHDPLNPTISWTLAAGDGPHQVWAAARDGAGNATGLGNEEIIVDTVKPTVPGTLTRSVSCSGPDRTVTLSFGTSTDEHLRGYRVYRSTDGSTWQTLATASAPPASDTHKKSLDSVRYYVVGYDKAGNESAATSPVTLTKNQCS